jgi:hypothetical protein
VFLCARSEKKIVTDIVEVQGIKKPYLSVVLLFLVVEI